MRVLSLLKMHVIVYIIAFNMASFLSMGTKAWFKAKDKKKRAASKDVKSMVRAARI